eukprot:12908668-Prorocentrum_lima.AAC.1
MSAWTSLRSGHARGTAAGCVGASMALVTRRSSGNGTQRRPSRSWASVEERQAPCASTTPPASSW